MRSSRGHSTPPSQQPTPHSPGSNIVVPDRWVASDKAAAECHGRQKPEPGPGSGVDSLPRSRPALPCSAGSMRRVSCGNTAAFAKSSSEVSGCAGAVPPAGGDSASSTIHVGGSGVPQRAPDFEKWRELEDKYTRTVSNLPREQKETRRSQAVVAGQESVYKRATKRRRRSPSPRHSPSTTASAEDALTTALLAEGGGTAARKRRHGAHGDDSTHVAGLQGSRELPSSAPGRPAAPVTGTAQSDVPAIQASQVVVGQTRVVKMERVTKPVGTVVETAFLTLLADAAAALPIPPNQLPEQPQVEHPQPGPIHSIQHDGPSASSKSDRTPDIVRTTLDPIQERAGVLLSNPLKHPPSAYPPPDSQAAAVAVSPPLGLSNPPSVGGQTEADHGSGAAFVPVSAVVRGLQREEFLAARSPQTGDSTFLMAANRVESSYRPYDTIPDNNNHSVPSPSLRAAATSFHPAGSPSLLIDDIAPDFAGFQQHVLKLNPFLRTKNNYLVDRIARQQCIRYKHLLDLRAKHQQAIAANNCSCGTMCISLGGRANVLDLKDDQRGLKPLSAGCFPQDIPMPPIASLPAEFECQLCFSAQQFKTPRNWTNHVYEDIQPFTCIWEGCNEGKMFKRKADWVLHENGVHRHVLWWTCDVGDCRKKFSRRNNFRDHLNRIHELAGSPTWVKVRQCRQETTELPQNEPCRFCGLTFVSWKELTDHLAEHMTHISLPMHELVAKKELDEDTIIRHIQEPPPRTFPATFPTRPSGHLPPPQDGGGMSRAPYNFPGLLLPGYTRPPPSPQIPQVLPSPSLTKHPLPYPFDYEPGGGQRQLIGHRVRLPGPAELIRGISAYGTPAHTAPYDSGSNGGGVSLLLPPRLPPRSDQPDSQPEPQSHPPHAHQTPQTS